LVLRPVFCSDFSTLAALRFSGRRVGVEEIVRTGTGDTDGLLFLLELLLEEKIAANSVGSVLLAGVFAGAATADGDMLSVRWRSVCVLEIVSESLATKQGLTRWQRQGRHQQERRVASGWRRGTLTPSALSKHDQMLVSVMLQTLTRDGLVVARWRRTLLLDQRTRLGGLGAVSIGDGSGDDILAVRASSVFFAVNAGALGVGGAELASVCKQSQRAHLDEDFIGLCDDETLNGISEHLEDRSVLLLGRHGVNSGAGHKVGVFSQRRRKGGSATHSVDREELAKHGLYGGRACRARVVTERAPSSSSSLLSSSSSSSSSSGSKSPSAGSSSSGSSSSSRVLFLVVVRFGFVLLINCLILGVETGASIRPAWTSESPTDITPGASLKHVGEIFLRLRSFPITSYKESEHASPKVARVTSMWKEASGSFRLRGGIKESGAVLVLGTDLEQLAEILIRSLPLPNPWYLKAQSLYGNIASAGRHDR
ncbi:hypothetical protein KCU93_g447, partial [Aureobasidium melanogenum]